MKPRPMLTTDAMVCPYCKSEEVEPRQMGHHVNTLMLICFHCTRHSHLKGPEVAWTPELQKQPVIKNMDDLVAF